MICPECENGKIWHPFAHIKNTPSFCKWEPCNRCQGSGVAYCCDGEDFNNPNLVTQDRSLKVNI